MVGKTTLPEIAVDEALTTIPDRKDALLVLGGIKDALLVLGISVCASVLVRCICIGDECDDGDIIGNVIGAGLVRGRVLVIEGANLIADIFLDGEPCRCASRRLRLRDLAWWALITLDENRNVIACFVCPCLSINETTILKFTIFLFRCVAPDRFIRFFGIVMVYVTRSYLLHVWLMIVS